MIIQSSFEDFLYIIIGLVWIAFSFYKAKKKKQEKNKPSQTSEKQSFVDSLLNEIGFHDEVNEPSDDDPYQVENNVDTNLNPTADEEPETVFSYDDYYEESNHNSAADVIEKKPLLANSEIEKAYKIYDKRNANNKSRKNIDLRKAVIYSEVLKKVYF